MGPEPAGAQRTREDWFAELAASVDVVGRHGLARLIVDADSHVVIAQTAPDPVQVVPPPLPQQFWPTAPQVCRLSTYQFLPNPVASVVILQPARQPASLSTTASPTSRTAPADC